MTLKPEVRHTAFGNCRSESSLPSHLLSNRGRQEAESGGKSGQTARPTDDKIEFTNAWGDRSHGERCFISGGHNAAKQAPASVAKLHAVAPITAGQAIDPSYRLSVMSHSNRN